MDLHAAIVAAAALPAQGTGAGEGAVVDDGLVVILNDNMLAVVSLDLFSVDFGAGILGLPQRADIKIIIQDALHGDDGPVGLDPPLAGLALLLLTHLLGHAGGGDALVGEIVGNFLVAPAVVVV